MPETIRRRQPAGREPLRAIPAGHVRPPQFRWPSEAHKLPTHCAHCGAALLRGDVPTASYPVSDCVCLSCSRVACELVADGWAPARPLSEAARAALRLPERRGRPPKGELEPCSDGVCLRPGRDGGLCASCNVRRWRGRQRAEVAP
jgi:hypothetical protein